MRERSSEHITAYADYPHRIPACDQSGTRIGGKGARRPPLAERWDRSSDSLRDAMKRTLPPAATLGILPRRRCAPKIKKCRYSGLFATRPAGQVNDERREFHSRASSLRPTLRAGADGFADTRGQLRPPLPRNY